MTDFHAEPAALTDAAASVQRAADALLAQADAVPAPDTSIFGLLLANAAAFTYPAATDAVKDFIEELSTSTASIGQGLAEAAESYRETEAKAVGLVKGIGVDG